MGKKRIGWISIALLALMLVFSCNNESELSEPEEEGNSGETSDKNDGTSHEDDADYIWDGSAVIPIFLNGTSIEESTDGATANGSVLTITSAGNYGISGSLTDGQIIVNTEDNATVRLILSGVDITCLKSAPIYVKNAKKIVVVLAENTTSKLTDGASYTYDIPADEEPNAVIFSKSDLTIYGSGSLIVDANFNDGIASKDGLIVKSGTITVNSVDDGIVGKDYLIVKGGSITVISSGDGLKSGNDSNTSVGYISIETGTISVTSSGDAIVAESEVLIKDGKFNLVSGGGSNSKASATVSSKGIKGTVSVITDGGNFTISSADDAIHSNGSVTINAGTFTLSSGDDGIHADVAVALGEAEINLTKSFEGIEAATISVDKSTIHLLASDDGFNATKGSTAGGTESNDGSNLTISSGYVFVNASGGDGLDSNGNITITGGTVIVHGPQSQPEVGMDYNGTCKITSGTLVISGTNSNMTQGPSTTSTQYAVKIISGSGLSSGTLFHIQDASGNDLLTFKPVRSYYSIVYSSSALKSGSTCDVYTGGSSTGTETDGLYVGGTYSGGTKYTSFTVSGIVTSIGTGGGGGPGGR